MKSTQFLFIGILFVAGLFMMHASPAQALCSLGDACVPGGGAGGLDCDAGGLGQWDPCGCSGGQTPICNNFGAISDFCGGNYCAGAEECGGCEGGGQGGNPTCSDGVQNQNETDVDCGGVCGGCGNGQGCGSGGDCQSGYCSGGVCGNPPPPPPACGDGSCNGGETCGSCPGDCGACAFCGDGIVNGGEQCDLGGGNGACPSTCSGSCTNQSCAPTVGSLTVSDPAGASWTITGIGSGNTNQTFNGVTFGTYSMPTPTLAGYTCSSDSPKTINAGAPDATFTISCTPITTGSISVNNPGPVAAIDWTIPGAGAGSGNFATYSPVPLGTYSISITSPLGYTCAPVPAGNRTITAIAPNATFDIVCADVTPPTGTITTITSPRNTILTSNGYALGTIAGTGSDATSNVTAVYVVIREWDKLGGAEGACDAHNRDWNGSAWVAACTAWMTPVITPALNVNWTAATGLAGQMTYGRSYHVYLNVVDAAGNSSLWVPNVVIEYIAPQAPTASNVTGTLPDYCTTGPAVTVSWTYGDFEGTPQTAYQVQVDDDPAFGSPAYDSGKIAGASTSVYAGTGLTWNTVYYSRARVWDGDDMASAWTNQLFCSGTGCIGGNSWRTPIHAYPSGVANFTWSPNRPIINTLVNFTDVSSCTPGACASWTWTFGDGSPASGLQFPTHTYPTAGTYEINLSVTDADGLTCSSTPGTRFIRVQQQIPDVKEVLPK